MERTWKQTAQFLPVWLLIISAGGDENVSGQLDQAEGVANNSVIAVQPGGAAKLPCPIPAEMFGTTVSWIRRKDTSLLSVDDNMITSDKRFFVSHPRHTHNKDSRHTQVWFLHLKNVTMEDQGEYDCQTSTHPHVSYITVVRVQRAYSVIQGPKERMVAAGSNLQLVCVFKDATVPPSYVFWYQDAKMVNYDDKRGINVTSDPRDRSILKVSGVKVEHEGNYTCAPSNVASSSVLVHVINETTESGANSERDQKREEKTPVRQLGVKSASSAGCRDLPHHLELFLLGFLLLAAFLFQRVFQSSH